ncbi:galactarate dehydratase [Primorskyibacter sedentarius]|uniref:Galactarate dehydratase n=1 Tax=Primorskyibacter sedentarius TaxID=745311 RepID=A0A4R3JII3_9RHOB|nr:galactarate dehydratase [Primorskyibacter sedentarius]TCS65832.1 galactarate dehydratase [Primorskyibacter sedentarius]
MPKDHEIARVIAMHPADNVAIVANDLGLEAGAQVPDGPMLRERVPQGHKVALTDIPRGAPVRRYNVIIGHAAEDLPAGSWVNEMRLDMPSAPGFEGLPMATAKVDPGPPVTGKSFEGYRNADGRVGTRNLLAVSTTVQCVSGVVEHAVARIRAEILPRFPNVDGVVALEHVYGCGVAIDAPGAEIPIRTLRNIALNPNFGGRSMVVSLGCEKLQPDRLMPPGTLSDLDTVRLQDNAGYEQMIRALMESAEEHLAELDQRRREVCPASDLVLGVQCGGSDAFSGVTANPALGQAADLLVRAGGTVMFSENTEVRDGIDQLTARAATPEVAQAIIEQLAWYDAYLARGGADRAANTTPGNKAGGLSNIVEKAMGSIVKSGTGPISGVVAPGERATTKGLLFAATPASDFICGTLQLAAGATVHVFTTGRGTPYSLEAMPVLKVSTRSELARRWHDLIDIDAGPVALGEATIEEMGALMLDTILATASGRATKAERLGLRNALALFNPAPIT